MKKLLSIIALIMLAVSPIIAQDIYMTNSGTISFSSHAPLEDIFAESKKLGSAINIKTGKVSCKVKISTLKMENSLQQEHLNEKYLESHKYAYAQFSGTIIGDVDWKKDGEYKVKVNGKLNIHGVAKDRTVDATITIKDGKISVLTEFKVKVADHKVDIPKLVFQKVAEEVEIKMEADYEVYVPKKK